MSTPNNDNFAPAWDQATEAKQKEHTYRYAELTEDQLSEICRNGLKLGNLWRPDVKAARNEDGSFSWYDLKDDCPTRHGPFPSARDAYIDAIETEGVESPQDYGLQYATPTNDLPSAASSSPMEDAKWIMDFLKGIEAQGKHAPTETMQRLIDSIAAMQVTPRIVIGLDGGIIQGATANMPIEYLVYDYDIEGADFEDIASRPSLDGDGEVEVFNSDVRIPEINSGVVTKAFSAAEAPEEPGHSSPSLSM